MSNETKITLAESIFSLQDLARLMNAHKKNSSGLKIQLCFEDDEHESIEDQCIDLCNELFEVLVYAQRCVEYCARLEKKNSENSIYYDKHIGANGGARALLKDINKLIEKYHERLVEIDLMK